MIPLNDPPKTGDPVMLLRRARQFSPAGERSAYLGGRACGDDAAKRSQTDWLTNAERPHDFSPPAIRFFWRGQRKKEKKEKPPPEARAEDMLAKKKPGGSKNRAGLYKY